MEVRPQTLRNRIGAAVVGAAGALRTTLRAWAPGSATPGGIVQLNLLAALVAPALMLATILFMADRQNLDARAVETARAVTVQSYLIDRAALVGADNANWDDAYLATVRRLDRDWLDRNLGPDAFGTIDFHDVYVIDGAGRTLYASERGTTVAATAGDALGSALGRLRVRADRSAPPRGATAFVAARGRTAIASLIRIRPIDPALSTAADPARYLLIVKHLDGPALAEVERASGFSDLRLLPAGTAGGVAVRGDDGRAVATLAWTSNLPGYDSARDVLPVALIVVALLGYAGFVGASSARRRSDELLDSRKEALALARRDALTDLANRRGFVQRVATAVSADTDAALLYLDLDGFKEVNDAFGHAVGDALLVEAAQRLRRLSPTEPSRFGGDEFAVLLSGRHGGRERAERLAQAIVEAFAQPLAAEARKLYVGASVGIALAAPGVAADELVRRADVAMYAAKAAGKRRWRLYESSLEAGREQRRRLAAELREALDADGVDVRFQPVVRAADSVIVAAEALARWHSPSAGDIDPDLFISVAEESGLIPLLTRRVLRRACVAAIDWDIAINLSAAEIWDLAFADALLAILAETGMPASRLILEITESRLIREPQRTAETFAMLRGLGVRVSLDDFGTGFASLSQLGALPLDGLKLTRGFLESVAGDATGEAAAAIVRLAGAMRLPVTAEGVETEAQAALFREAGCTYLQGWHFGRPMTAASLADLLTGADRPVALIEAD